MNTVRAAQMRVMPPDTEVVGLGVMLLAVEVAV